MSWTQPAARLERVFRHAPVLREGTVKEREPRNG